MEKYTTYKPSGVEWIGDIPEHWEIKKLKHITEYKNGVSFKSEDFSKDEIIPVIRIGEVGDVIDFDDCVKLPISFLERYSDFIINRGDILVGLTGGTIGKSGMYNYDTPSLLNQRVCIIRNKKPLNNKLLYYFVKSEVFIRYIFYNCYGGGQDNVGKEDIINMVFPFPPIPEQHQIVQFLDEKTEIIDKLISTKERKIELLKEQRTSLINQVITKGLNPNVKMKDSGVEWIGEIPEHWEISKLKYKFSFKGGGTPSKEKDEYWDGDIPWVSPKDMKSLEISSSQDTITQLGLENSSTTIVEENSLLIVVRSGILQRTIPVGINTIPVSINQDLKSLTSKNGFPVKFLYYFIKGNEINLLKDWSKEGTTVESIEMEFMSNSILPLPSQNEQHQIVEYLDKQTKEIDDLMSLEQKKIEVLKEYRQSLISELITGKIKVSNN